MRSLLRVERRFSVALGVLFWIVITRSRGDRGICFSLGADSFVSGHDFSRAANVHLGFEGARLQPRRNEPTVDLSSLGCPPRRTTGRSAFPIHYPLSTIH